MDVLVIDSNSVLSSPLTDDSSAQPMEEKKDNRNNNNNIMSEYQSPQTTPASTTQPEAAVVYGTSWNERPNLFTNTDLSMFFNEDSTGTDASLSQDIHLPLLATSIDSTFFSKDGWDMESLLAGPPKQAPKQDQDTLLSKDCMPWMDLGAMAEIPLTPLKAGPRQGSTGSLDLTGWIQQGMALGRKSNLRQLDMKEGLTLSRQSSLGTLDSKDLMSCLEPQVTFPTKPEMVISHQSTLGILDNKVLRSWMVDVGPPKSARATTAFSRESSSGTIDGNEITAWMDRLPPMGTLPPLNQQSSLGTLDSKGMFAAMSDSPQNRDLEAVPVPEVVVVDSVPEVQEGAGKRKRKRKPRPKILPDVKVYVEIETNDVLSGRGGKSNHHPGNNRYREEIQNNREFYATLGEDNDAKASVAEAVVTFVQSNGGRFLEKDDVGWFVIHDRAARLKASQALREDDDQEKRAAKRARYLANLARKKAELEQG